VLGIVDPEPFGHDRFTRLEIRQRADHGDEALVVLAMGGISIPAFGSKPGDGVAVLGVLIRDALDDTPQFFAG
jgi:predicted flavoprotein YhiN